MVKIWLITLLLLPALAWGDKQAETKDTKIEEVLVHGAAPEDDGNDPLNWVDSSHAYATDQAQALAEWMDGYFGDPNADLENPESLVRLEWANSFDEENDYKSRVKLRGKVQLPRVSERLNLVFNSEDGDDLTEDDRDRDDQVGLLYKVRERNRSRVDLTMSLSSLRPGIRYRNQGPLGDVNSYRFTQRLEWEEDDGFITKAEINFDRSLAENELLRWSNRVDYGEETDGAEWRTKLSLRQRLKPVEKKHQFVVSYFGSIKGVTDPSYVKNYRLGVLLRRQFYRPFLFAELEPSYNFRKHEGESREGAWNIIVRFEIALHRDLRRKPLLKKD